MWVKICANTNLDDALLAADAGADAVGFVFAESARRVTADQVAAITARLPKKLEKVGVFGDARFDELVHSIEYGGLTGVQLHSAGDTELAARLRSHFRNDLRILQVIHYRQGLEAQLRAAQENSATDGVLIDSRTATLLGGTGQSYDWKAASRRVAESASGLRLIVAGGLNPENVGEAIATMRPWGVDVATGVEISPGKKDPAKVRAFIENARIAAHRAKMESPVEV
ncbi:phosphoribosylanthranilate isomerase [Silvibacterium bohemicum]|uniref:N-(5'-phosphoribosyl)anthranilate isomerase n=1 Tax=Silvibacterium bohemicum TaxID=1577686 RepID=A0A841JXU1_9BACT|nr:phosphoribosylanthranilate isomerase [Silvibacterium bohemicum]MBB6145970.1 phosphoribosylanthranilate isomerase [Silvibacterium bohemicum]